jgi:hypothetical protein
MTDYEDYEIEFNAAGIASISKGGITKIAIKLDSDSATPPADDTVSGFNFGTLRLVITYEEAGALTVVTLAATDATTESVVMNGEITQGSATKRGFDYGESSESLVSEWYEEGEFGVEEFSHEVTGLTPGQNFCHRAKAAE